LTEGSAGLGSGGQVLDRGRAGVQGDRVAASSPGRHLLALIADALQLPEPAATPADEAAYLALVDRRAGLVLRACRQALDGPGDGGLLRAAGDLFSGVSCLPATSYAHARSDPGTAA
jgi:hypothetical protein